MPLRLRKVKKPVFASGKRFAKTFGAKIGLYRKKKRDFPQKIAFSRGSSRFRACKRTKISITAF
jgi:hypothetical protein